MMHFIWLLAALAARSLAADTPKALVIPASEYFEGNDGPWSTFDLRVGTPEQYVRVLVSTASAESLVVWSEESCSPQAFGNNPPPSDCAVSRGNLFNSTKSSSWHGLGRFGINQNGVGLEANLGYNVNVENGLEHVGIGLLGPALANQTVGGIAATGPFYLGIFGINNQPLNFTTLSNFSSPSFVTTLKDQKVIPSVSWSYTAGAQYRLKQVYGQLIFSGYDTSRFKENAATFTMAEDITRDLVVALQSISYSGATSATLLSDPINIFIDSTDPFLWLPGDVCDAFEKAFGLTLDAKSGLYLVSDTHRNELLAANAQVSFRLGDVKTGGETVTIVLPYAAFDRTAKAPLVEGTSYYFPLKRANSSTQYTLGRTFLQEAYLTADYERKVFNVSACVWNQGAQQNIITINPAGADTPTSPGGNTSGGGGSGGDNNGSGSSKLAGGTIAGIAVGAVAGALLILGVIVYVLLRKRRKWMAAGFAAAPKPERDDSVLEGPVFNDPSTANNSGPVSAADLTGARSTAEYSRSGADSHSPADHAVIGAAAGAGAAGAAAAGAPGGSTPELDGTAVRPNTELDGTEVLTHKPEGSTARPVARNAGVYELPATEARDHTRGGSGSGSGSGRGSGSTTAELQPPSEERTWEHSPPSPFASTVDGSWAHDERPESELVSPSSPHYRGRAF